jgi:hypothetical protein
MKIFKKTNRAAVIREATPGDGAIANYKFNKAHGEWDFINVSYFPNPEEAEKNLRGRGFRPAPDLLEALEPPSKF